MYKVFSRSDYTTVRYSVKHFIDFIRGMFELLRLFPEGQYAKPLQHVLSEIRQELDKPVFQKIDTFQKDYKPMPAENLALCVFFNYNKLSVQRLQDLFAKIDAWCSLARATVEHDFHFPEIVASETPLIEAQDLYHPLIENAVGYNFSLTEKNNFLFLTGANMAGKSTCIRAVGIAV